MTREEIEKKIAEMEAGIAELKNELEKAEDINPDVFIPKGDEEYWSMYSDGKKSFKRWEDTSHDKDRLAIGNVFHTREEAEFEVERLKVIHELKMYAEPRDIKLDGIKEYFFIAYNFNDDDIDLAFSRWGKSSAIYFSSEDRAWKAIKAVGEDRVKKYYLCVEEGDI